MSNHGPIYMPGDAVYYTGEKNKQALSNKDGKPIKGWIHSAVRNEEDTFVVWFPDTKDEASYVLNARDLAKVRPAKTVDKVNDGPVVEHIPNRRKRED